MGSNFFGLTHKYIEGVYNEMFELKYHGGFSIFESYNLPIKIRRWFINRLVKQFETEAKAREKAAKKKK